MCIRDRICGPAIERVVQSLHPSVPVISQGVVNELSYESVILGFQMTKYAPVSYTHLFQEIIDVASGRKQSFAEKYKLHNDLCIFNPAPIT